MVAAVRASHVVGENRSSGLVSTTASSESHQILVGLLGIGLLRIRPDNDLAVKTACALPSRMPL